MRIIAGAYRGTKIEAPKGRNSRPTADRAREALFNVMEHGDFPRLAGTRVIDLFAGSGALGLEALSRGADYALFVETDAKARGAIRANIEALGLYGATRIHRRSAEKLGAMPASAGGPFDVAFLDPPYGRDMPAPCLEGLDRGGWLKPDAIAVLEQGVGEAPTQAVGFTQLETRDYGAARVTFFRYSPAAPPCEPA